MIEYYSPLSQTYYIRDRLGGIRPIVVRAYVVPGLIHNSLSVKGLKQSGYRVIRDVDEEESGVFAVINKKIDKSKSFPFMGMALKTGAQLKPKDSKFNQIQDWKS
jgi:hypothetical protein